MCRGHTLATHSRCMGNNTRQGRDSQLHSFTTSQLHSFTASQLHNLTTSQPYWNGGKGQSLSGACRGGGRAKIIRSPRRPLLELWQRAKPHSFTASQPHSFTTSQLRSLTPSHPPSLTTSQLHSLTTSQLHSCKASQLHNFTASQPHSRSEARCRNYKKD